MLGYKRDIPARKSLQSPSSACYKKSAIPPSAMRVFLETPGLSSRKPSDEEKAAGGSPLRTRAYFRRRPDQGPPGTTRQSYPAWRTAAPAKARFQKRSRSRARGSVEHRVRGLPKASIAPGHDVPYSSGACEKMPRNSHRGRRKNAHGSHGGAAEPASRR